MATLTIIGIYLAFAIAYGAETGDLGIGDQPDFGTSFGGLDILGGIIEAVVGFVLLLIGALVFNVDGAPPYIQFPVATGIIASLGWSIAALIRGN